MRGKGSEDMPKQKITREMILDEGFRLASQEGMDQVQVKIIAKNLNCSVQPIYSYFKNMNDLKDEIARKATDLFLKEVYADTKSKPYLLSLFHAFLVQSQENYNLYRCFLYDIENNPRSLYSLFTEQARKQAAAQLGLSEGQAEILLDNLFIYLLGLIKLVHHDDLQLKEAMVHLDNACDAFLRYARRPQTGIVI